MHTHSILISRAFWTLFALESVACAAGMVWATYDTKGWGPEGPVGAWLIYLVPPIFLGIPLVIVLIGRSAAYQENWRAVWLVMERGAPWKDELALGQPVVDVLTSDLRSRRARHSEIPDEMEKILAKYGVETPASVSSAPDKESKRLVLASA